MHGWQFVLNSYILSHNWFLSKELQMDDKSVKTVKSIMLFLADFSIK